MAASGWWCQCHLAKNAEGRRAVSWASVGPLHSQLGLYLIVWTLPLLGLNIPLDIMNIASWIIEPNMCLTSIWARTEQTCTWALDCTQMFKFSLGLSDMDLGSQSTCPPEDLLSDLSERGLTWWKNKVSMGIWTDMNIWKNGGYGIFKENNRQK